MRDSGGWMLFSQDPATGLGVGSWGSIPSPGLGEQSCLPHRLKSERAQLGVLPGAGDRSIPILRLALRALRQAGPGSAARRGDGWGLLLGQSQQEWHFSIHGAIPLAPSIPARP